MANITPIQSHARGVKSDSFNFQPILKELDFIQNLDDIITAQNTPEIPKNKFKPEFLSDKEKLNLRKTYFIKMPIFFMGNCLFYLYCRVFN